MSESTPLVVVNNNHNSSDGVSNYPSEVTVPASSLAQPLPSSSLQDVCLPNQITNDDPVEDIGQSTILSTGEKPDDAVANPALVVEKKKKEETEIEAPPAVVVSVPKPAMSLAAVLENQDDLQVRDKTPLNAQIPTESVVSQDMEMSESNQDVSEDIVGNSESLNTTEKAKNLEPQQEDKDISEAQRNEAEKTEPQGITEGQEFLESKPEPTKDIRETKPEVDRKHPRASREQSQRLSSVTTTPTRTVTTTSARIVTTTPAPATNNTQDVTTNRPSRISPNNIKPSTNSWLWRQSEIMASTPSRRDGISASEEMVRRSKGANFIIQVCLLLKLPSMTIYAATEYLQRFYQRFSLKYYQEYEIGATCVLLATKIEETNRYLRDIVIAVVKVAMKNFKLLITEQSKDFWRWRDVIIYMEEILLEGLCFDLNLESPFTYLEKYVEQLEINNVAVLCKSAWAFVNDSARTYLSIVFPANVIAGAGLYWAAKYNNTHFRIPKSLEQQSLANYPNEPVTWLQGLGLSRNDVKKCVAALVKFYEDLPILKEVGATYNKRHLEKGEDLESSDRKRRATTDSKPSSEPAVKHPRL